MQININMILIVFYMYWNGKLVTQLKIT